MLFNLNLEQAKGGSGHIPVHRHPSIAMHKLSFTPHVSINACSLDHLKKGDKHAVSFLL